MSKFLKLQLNRQCETWSKIKDRVFVLSLLHKFRAQSQDEMPNCFIHATEGLRKVALKKSSARGHRTSASSSLQPPWSLHLRRVEQWRTKKLRAESRRWRPMLGAFLGSMAWGKCHQESCGLYTGWELNRVEDIVHQEMAQMTTAVSISHGATTNTGMFTGNWESKAQCGSDTKQLIFQMLA